MLTSIPDINYQILLNTDIRDLASLCSTRKLSHICYDNTFWHMKFKHDNIILPPHIYPNMNWIKAYYTMMNIPPNINSFISFDIIDFITQKVCSEIKKSAFQPNQDMLKNLSFLIILRELIDDNKVLYNSERTLIKKFIDYCFSIINPTTEEQINMLHLLQGKIAFNKTFESYYDNQFFLQLYLMYKLYYK